MVLWLRCGWTQQDKREGRTSHHQLMRLGLLGLAGWADY